MFRFISFVLLILPELTNIKRNKNIKIDRDFIEGTLTVRSSHFYFLLSKIFLLFILLSDYHFNKPIKLHFCCHTIRRRRCFSSKLCDRDPCRLLCAVVCRRCSDRPRFSSCFALTRSDSKMRFRLGSRCSASLLLLREDGVDTLSELLEVVEDEYDDDDELRAI